MRDFGPRCAPNSAGGMSCQLLRNAHIRPVTVRRRKVKNIAARIVMMQAILPKSPAVVAIWTVRHSCAHQCHNGYPRGQ
jgi:hypothetical protein